METPPIIGTPTASPSGSHMQWGKIILGTTLLLLVAGGAYAMVKYVAKPTETEPTSTNPRLDRLQKEWAEHGITEEHITLKLDSPLAANTIRDYLAKGRT